MAAASSSSGTAFMPSQLAGVAAASEYCSDSSGCCVPATVRHISRSLSAAAAAADGGVDPAFSIDGIATSNVRVFGRVVSFLTRDSDVSFTLDDGTGKIPLVRWIVDQTDVRDASYIKAGVYVRVHVNMTAFQANNRGFARSIRLITDFNEVVLHFLECIHVHMENTRMKFSAYSGTGGEQKDLQSMILKVLHGPGVINLENGIHIDELARRTGAPKGNIMEAINLLVDTGYLYWTMDDCYVKSVCNG